MPDLKTILVRHQAPLTLAGVATGFQPALLADLARAAPGARGVHRARRGGDARDRSRPRRSSRPSSRSLAYPGVGLPALRPRLARRCA